jgi:hypothetical protein
LKRGVISAAAENCTGEVASSAGVPISCRPTSIHSSAAGEAPLSPDDDATKKSPKTAGGVTRLGGKGPFQAFSRTEDLVNRSPVGDEDAGRRPSSRTEDLGGEEDLALNAADLDAEACFSQTLDSADG